MVKNTENPNLEGKLIIPDTSAILTGKIDIISMNCLVPSSVIKEIKKGKMARLLNNDLSLIRITDPKVDFLNQIIIAAKKTGDFPYLSQTDMEIIAIALEYNGVIISDDYSLQNVSSILGIEFYGCGIDKIKENIVWGYLCKGCGTKYERKINNCIVCGHRITRYPIKNSETRKL
jgi:UPF0271 protein